MQARWLDGFTFAISQSPSLDRQSSVEESIKWRGWIKESEFKIASIILTWCHLIGIDESLAVDCNHFVAVLVHLQAFGSEI